MLVNNDTMFDRDDDGLDSSDMIDVPEDAIRSKEEVLGGALEKLGSDLKTGNVDEIEFGAKRDIDHDEYRHDVGLGNYQWTKVLTWTVEL